MVSATASEKPGKVFKSHLVILCVVDYRIWAGLQRSLEINTLRTPSSELVFDAVTSNEGEAGTIT